MKEINYQLRPATEADYQYCYDLLKQNMFELFSHHWGGWKPDAFRQDFCAANTTMVTMEGRDIGYFSLKKSDAGMYLENIQLSRRLPKSVGNVENSLGRTSGFL